MDFSSCTKNNQLKSNTLSDVFALEKFVDGHILHQPVVTGIGYIYNGHA